jgi:hypothetical protein
MKKYNMKKGGQKGGQENYENLSNSNDASSTLLGKKEFVPIKRLPYDIKIFSILCILGIIFRLIFAHTSSDYATASVWGYSFTVLALLGLITSSFAIASKNQFSQGIMGFFKNMLPNALPIILTLVIVMMIILQNISFYDQINSGKVADEFYSFSGVSSILILVQICLVISFLFDKLKGVQTNDNNTGSLMTAFASEINSIILILTIVNFTFVGMLQVILKYFSTDG